MTLNVDSHRIVLLLRVIKNLTQSDCHVRFFKMLCGACTKMTFKEKAKEKLKCVYLYKWAALAASL